MAEGTGGVGAADRHSGGRSRGRGRRMGSPHGHFGMAQVGELDGGGVGFPFFGQQAVADALSVGTGRPMLGLRYLTICHSLRIALLHLPVLHGHLHISTQNSKPTTYLPLSLMWHTMCVCQRGSEP